METKKKCPKCLKEYSSDAEQCTCGFKFYNKPVEDENLKTNTIVINDTTPLFLWQLISFILPPLGFYFYFAWSEKWSKRSQACGKMALIMSIVWFVVGIAFLLIAFGIKNGDVLI